MNQKGSTEPPPREGNPEMTDSTITIRTTEFKFAVDLVPGDVIAKAIPDPLGKQHSVFLETVTCVRRCA